MNTLRSVLLLLFILTFFNNNNAKIKNKSVVDNIVDIKDFKKLLRTKTNVLVCFVNNFKEPSNLIAVFKEVAEEIKGQGTMVLIDCSSDAKKLCKKLKVNPQPSVLKHYKDGEFHKDYDRKYTLNSMLNFMRDPTGDIPWEEDPTSTEVIHVSNSASLAKLIRKEVKPLMVMFYAPWCGFCKTLKPEYAAAAKELKKFAVMAAIDVNRPENSVVRTHYNITGFPTLLYFENGVMKYQYEGENKQKALVDFMHSPSEPAPKIKEPEWSETDSDVVHLTSSNFDLVLKEESSALVMFYAPWCGHCKKMKPEYEKAAMILKHGPTRGMLAAVDATKEPSLASRFNVKGYPTVKYFVFGGEKFNVNVRESGKIIQFMNDPQEPPPPPPADKPWSDEPSDVVHLGEENYKTFMKKKKHVLVMYYAPWCPHCKRIKPDFMQAAEHFKDDPRTEFAAVDCTIHQSICSENEVNGYPTLKYISYLNKVVKPYTGGRTTEAFIAFMQNPDMKSGDSTFSPPSKNDNSPPNSGSSDALLELNKSNFKKMIASDQSTIVLFYAQWCNICKNFKPVFRQAAEELKGKYSVQFALYDCTEEGEVMDEYDITAFPAVKIFKKGAFVQNYKGKRTLEDVKALVENLNVKTEL